MSFNFHPSFRFGTKRAIRFEGNNFIGRKYVVIHMKTGGGPLIELPPVFSTGKRFKRVSAERIKREREYVKVFKIDRLSEETSKAEN